MIIEML